jgi:hypothetical protein
VIQLPNAPPLVHSLPLKEYDIISRRGEMVTFRGQLLATASSQRPDHTHPGLKFAPRKWQCSACRWFRPTLWLADPEVPIVCVDAEGRDVWTKTVTDGNERRYVVQSSGMSIVPGEIERSAVQVLSSVYEVVRSLTITNRGPVFIPDASVAMLNKAGDYDPHIDAVYDLLIEPLDRHRAGFDSAHTQ